MNHVAFALKSTSTLNDHDAAALALILEARGSPCGSSAAEKLLECICTSPVARCEIELDGEETLALLAALNELRADRVPERINALRYQLEIALERD